MKTTWLGIVVPAIVSLVAVAAVAGWLTVDVGPRPKIRNPGMDETPESEPEAVPLPPTPGTPIMGGGQPAAIEGAWPWFRGPQRDAICHEDVRLARSWPAAGPPVLWTVEMGEGYAGPVISEGCVYVLDYDVKSSADTMRCLSLADGGEIWRNSYPVLVTRFHGMSRTVSAVAGRYVVSLGPRCHVACWDKKTGECLWLIDLALEYQVTVPQWYAGQCPLVDGDRVVLAPASPTTLMMAVDVATGKVVWETPNRHGWEMTHSSVVPVEYAGRRMYVYCATGGVVGVSADDGAVLWESEDWKMHVALSPSPVDLGDGQLLLSSGYNKNGCLVLGLREQDGAVVAQTLHKLTPKQFNSEQQTPILYDGHLFGVRKYRGGQLVCMDLQGEEIYNSGKDKFGHGPYMIADGLIFLMGNFGRLTMAAASSDRYRPLGHVQVFPDGHDAWGPMALVAGRLIVRDMTRMACLDVSAKE
jgi:outer membrane protein assembly factor BamB